MSESDTPKPSPSSSSSHHHQHHNNLALYVVGQQQQPPPPLSTTTSSSPPLAHHQQQQVLFRDYRKGNWTVQETLTLITAKRLDDERRSRGTCSVTSTTNSCSPAGSTTPTTPRSAEQRWKWVENYCWKNDCLRSQNQCNDKWDNLLRDYKKVRDYELHNNNNNNQQQQPSYWSMERHDRKERNLPTNLSSEVFHALTDVLSRRNTRRSTSAGDVTPVSARPPAPPPPSPASTSKPLTPPPPPPPFPPAAAAALAPPPPTSATAAASFGAEGSTDTSESEEEENEEPDTKRRRLRERRRSLGSSVLRSASELARTLLACEEKREQRHRQMLQLEERRLKIEEERTEANRQAACGLISAVDGLSNAIHDLVSDHLRHGHAK